MSKTENFDLVKFLLSCVSNSNNGRPNFDAVAKELNIISKGAAQKRFERMIKAHKATAANGASVGDDGEETLATPTPVKKRKAPVAGGAKKIKPKKETDEEDKPAPKRRRGKAKAVKKEVKEEEDEESVLSEPPKSETAGDCDDFDNSGEV